MSKKKVYKIPFYNDNYPHDEYPHNNDALKIVTNDGFKAGKLFGAWSFRKRSTNYGVYYVGPEVNCGSSCALIAEKLNAITQSRIIEYLRGSSFWLLESSFDGRMLFFDRYGDVGVCVPVHGCDNLTIIDIISTIVEVEERELIDVLSDMEVEK